MITVNMKIPEVRTCEASSCAYNVNNSCHARAITIGDDINPMCDTYFDSGNHSQNTSRMAGVGACKVGACKHNDDFECQADHILIQMLNGPAKCVTFSA